MARLWQSVALLAVVSSVGLSQGWRTQTLHNSRPTLWDVKGSYPVFIAKTPVAGLANRELRTMAVTAFSAFAASAQKDVPELRRDGMNAEYAYEQGFEVTRATATLISVAYGTYMYTGGAHGMSYTTTAVFAQTPKGLKRIKAADLLRPGLDAHAVLAPEIFGMLLKLDRVSSLDSGAVTELTDAQLNRFTVGKDGITWYFDPYEMGSYAEGPVSATLTFAELKSYLAPWIHGGRQP